MARINVGRILHVARASGPWLISVAAFALSALLVLAVWYRVEFAQALLLLLVPMVLAAALSLQAARAIEAAAPEGPDLVRKLLRHRSRVQVLGMVAIFLTALYGMHHNLAALRVW